MATHKAKTQEQPWPDNVVGFRLSILPRHVVLLHKWLKAGRQMGLSDGSVYPPEDGGPSTEFVLIWVRENADPAYMIAPEGTQWIVTDYVRNRRLARTRGFEEALNAIRPVLPVDAAA
jgi:hypothetical protein